MGEFIPLRCRGKWKDGGKWLLNCVLKPVSILEAGKAVLQCEDGLRDAKQFGVFGQS